MTSSSSAVKQDSKYNSVKICLYQYQIEELLDPNSPTAYRDPDGNYYLGRDRFQETSAQPQFGGAGGYCTRAVVYLPLTVRQTQRLNQARKQDHTCELKISRAQQKDIAKALAAQKIEYFNGPTPHPP